MKSITECYDLSEKYGRIYSYEYKPEYKGNINCLRTGEIFSVGEYEIRVLSLLHKLTLDRRCACATKQNKRSKKNV